MPSAPPKQSEFANFSHPDHLADPKDWISLKLLCDELERELTEQRSHLLRKISGWILALQIFRRVEKHRMIDAASSHPRDLEYHRALLTFLLGNAEILLISLREHTDVDPKWIGLTFDDFHSWVRELRSDLHMWHGEISDQRRQNILSDVFGIES